jgi:hypothetical protein
MDNIDIPATLELILAIIIVVGFIKTFFMKTKPVEIAVDVAPYKVEKPTVEVVDHVVVVEVVETEAPAPVKKTRARKDTVAKKAPAAKKTSAKKPATKKA